MRNMTKRLLGMSLARPMEGEAREASSEDIAEVAAVAARCKLLETL